MKTLTTFLFLFSVLSASASRKEQITGKWIYVRMEYDESKVDESEKAIVEKMKEIYKDLSLYFKANGHYKIHGFGDTHEGDWSLSADEKKLITKDYNGSTEEMEIARLNDTLLVWKLDDGFSLHFKKVPPLPEDEIEKVKQETNVTATFEQVAKKWMLQRMDDPQKDAQKDPKVKEAAAEMIRESGSFFDFKPNGKFQQQVLGFEQKGTWNFNEKQTAIIVTIDGENKTYNLYSIAENELVLQLGVSGKRFVLKID